MSDFANSFGAGFFSAINENMERRKADADNWYAQRYEQAQQIAMQRRGKASGKIDSYVSTAQQLEGLGVPKDIVLATANQNPEDLNAMYKNVSEWQYSGIPMDEDFFRAAFKVKGAVSPNTTYEEFFSQMYLPVKRAAESDPEGFRADPEGSIFASLMGYNAQEKAQQKLSQQDIMGRSADAWLYDTEERSKPAGDAGVDVDYGMLGRATQRNDVNVSSSEIFRVNNEWDSRVETLQQKLILDEGIEAEEALVEANRRVAMDMAAMAVNSPEIAAALSRLGADKAIYLQGTQEEEEAPLADIVWEPADILMRDGSRVVGVDNTAGTAVVMTPDGQEVEMTFQEIKEIGVAKDEPIDAPAPISQEEPAQEINNPLEFPEISKSISDRLVAFGSTLPEEDRGLFRAASKSVKDTLSKVLDESGDLPPMQGSIPEEVRSSPEMLMIEQAMPMAPPEVKVKLYETITNSIGSMALPQQQDMFTKVWQESLGAIADLL